MWINRLIFASKIIQCKMIGVLTPLRVNITCFFPPVLGHKVILFTAEVETSDACWDINKHRLLEFREEYNKIRYNLIL